MYTTDKSTKASTKEELNHLHKLVTKRLADILEKGVLETVDPETGEATYSPASPAHISAAIRFLKDNDVTAILEATSDGRRIVDHLKTLPFDDVDDDTPNVVALNSKI